MSLHQVCWRNWSGYKCWPFPKNSLNANINNFEFGIQEKKTMSLVKRDCCLFQQWYLQSNENISSNNINNDSISNNNDSISNSNITNTNNKNVSNNSDNANRNTPIIETTDCKLWITNNYFNSRYALSKFFFMKKSCLHFQVYTMIIRDKTQLSSAL